MITPTHMCSQLQNFSLLRTPYQNNKCQMKVETLRISTKYAFIHAKLKCRCAHNMIANINKALDTLQLKVFVPCVSCYTNPLKVVHLCLEHIHLMAMKYLTMQDAASRITNFLQYILTNIIQNTFYNIYVSNILMHAFSDMDSTNTRSNKVSIYVREEPAVSCR